MNFGSHSQVSPAAGAGANARTGIGAEMDTTTSPAPRPRPPRQPFTVGMLLSGDAPPPAGSTPSNVDGGAREDVPVYRSVMADYNPAAIQFGAGATFFARNHEGWSGDESEQRNVEKVVGELTVYDEGV